MVVARGVAAANPCDRRLPIFDGKERFDLVLSYKGQMKVSEQQPSGQPGMAHVCRVKYQPIAGHKVEAEHSYHGDHRCHRGGAASDPERQHVRCPIRSPSRRMVGYATIVSRRVEIEIARASRRSRLLH